MSNSIISRLKALEAAQPGHIVILAEDRDGNRFECSIEELEAHGEPATSTINGMSVYGREWGFVKILSGYNLNEARRVLDCIDSARVLSHSAPPRLTGQGGYFIAGKGKLKGIPLFSGKEKPR